MRGKVAADLVTVHFDRITPAYAGKSFHFFGSRCGCRDHPRLCGEKIFIPRKSGKTMGSPPPMRGKGCSHDAGVIDPRITPAYAGKSRGLYRWCSGHQDHPRLCGEKSNLLSLISVSTGSPPPMRGKASNHATMYINNRITPAYAGKSFVYKSEVQYNEDHPRLCGEKCNALCKPDCRTGSPPPMRGKVVDFDHVIAEDRITPAYAGKSCTQHTVLGNC